MENDLPQLLFASKLCRMLKKTLKVEFLVQEIGKDVYLLRINDRRIEFFEVILRIPEGITYNAYLVLGEESRILLDCWKASYSDGFLEAVKRVTDPRDLTHIVIHHMGPDHSGSLPLILNTNGFRAQVIPHPMAIQMIKKFYGLEARFKPVKDGEELKLDKTVKFIHAPRLHRPETIMSYLVEDGILFSGNAFGGYSIPETIFDESEDIISNYLPHVRKRVAKIIGAYRAHIVRNIEKISKLDITLSLIAPAHGLI